MMDSFSSQISITCNLWCVKIAQSVLFLIDCYSCLIKIAITALINTCVRIGSTAISHVLLIFRRGAFAKILNTIVAGIAIYMINLFTRPTTVMIKPNQSMSKISAPFKSNNPILAIKPTSISSFFANRCFAIGTNEPKQVTISVVKCSQKLLMRDHNSNITQAQPSLQGVW